MAGRRDALLGAAALIAAAERAALATPGLVATVGQVEVEPGAANVIPGRVAVSLDVRHPADPVRRGAVDLLLSEAAAAAAARGLDLTWRVDLEERGVPCDPALTDLLRDTLAGLAPSAPEVVSGAGHDAMVLAERWPVAMLFLRSPGGISHHPDEAVRPQDVALALEVMVAFLRRLRPPAPGGAAPAGTAGSQGHV